MQTVGPSRPLATSRAVLQTVLTPFDLSFNSQTAGDAEHRFAHFCFHSCMHDNVAQTELNTTAMWVTKAEPGAQRSGASGSTLNNTQRPCTSVLLVSGIQC